MDDTYFDGLMLPINKANELVTKFLRIEDDTFFYWCPANDRRLLDDEVLEHAKKCAEVVCLECIKEHCHESEHKNPIRQDIWVEYWQEVLKEVNKFKFI
jgi:hypothetical protein